MMMKRMIVYLLGLLLVGIGGLGLLAQEVGPEHVTPIELPLLLVGDEGPLPVIVRGEIAFPTACDYCYLHAIQYKVTVPQGTVCLVIELSNTSDLEGDLDLAVREGEAVSEDTDTYYYTYRTYEAGGEERLDLPEEGNSPLSPGEYYIGIISLIGPGAGFELRAAAYVEEILPDEIALVSNAPFSGEVEPHYLYGELERQFSILVPDEAELLAVQVMSMEGNLDTYIGEEPISSTPGGRVAADYHLRSAGEDHLLILEGPTAGRTWIVVGNPTNMQRSFTITATSLPELVVLVSGEVITGMAGDRSGLIPLLGDYLETERGLIGLTQYRIELPEGAASLCVELVGTGGGDVNLYLRQGSPVTVVDRAVVADLSSISPSNEKIVLGGAFLAEGGVYYIAVESVGDGEQTFRLTTEVGL
jgi:hypothetical protein